MNYSNYGRLVTLTATFLEEISQKEVDVTKEIYVQKSPYKLELVTSANKIKPGVPFKVRAHVKYHDKDMPVTDSHNPVKFVIKYNYNVMRTCIRKEYPMWFDPYFKYINKNESATQRALTEDDIVKTEYECREIRSIDEFKEVFPDDGIADILLEVRDNITDIKVDVSKIDLEISQFFVIITL